MTKTKKNPFPTKSFGARLGSMLRADGRRMFTSPMFYICLGIALVVPILILVMTTMTAGATVTDPNTGVETTMAAFTNAWQIIATESGAGMGMDMTAMCNINLMYFMAAVFLCLFTAEDFRSGYAKNLFTVRVKKSDYVASKTILGFLAGALFLIAFFVGAIFGGSVAGLPFTLGAAGVPGLVMCMLAKIFLMGVFVAIFLLMSVIGKSKSWMSVLLSLFGGMLLFMMIPMMTPLDAGPMHVFMCLAGGAIFAAAIGAGSSMVLQRTSLV